MPCPRTKHLNNVPRLRGEKHDISLKILHPAGFETARQAATTAERHALTIAPCPHVKFVKNIFATAMLVFSSSSTLLWGPRVVVSTASVRGSVPGLGGLKEAKMFLPHPRVKGSIVGSLCDREVACSASDRQGSNVESCVLRTVSSDSSHYPQEVLLAQFSLYVHKGGLKPDSFHLL